MDRIAQRRQIACDRTWTERLYYIVISFKERNRREVHPVL